MGSKDGCQGQHVLAPGCESAIAWRPETQRFERVRVRDYTCECMPTVYELCEAGGVAFIRRTHRERGRLAIEEFTARRTEVVRLWEQLFTEA